MGRNLIEIVAILPPEEQAAIETHYQGLKHEVEGLRQLRQLAGKAQADVANALKIRQPSISKIEKQADMYLSTLRGYVEAVGGTLELIVTLPSRPPLKLRSLGDAGFGQAASGRSRKPAPTR